MLTGISGILLTGTASLLLLAVCVHTLFRKKPSIENFCISFFIFVLVLMEAVNWLAFSQFIKPEMMAVFLPESFLPLASLLFSLTYGRRGPLKSVTRTAKTLAFLAMAFPASVAILPKSSFFAAPVTAGNIFMLGPGGYWFYLGIMLYCIIALFNLETTFKVYRGMDRWKIKFELIGYGAVLSVLIFYYSQGLLYHSLNLNFIPARSGVFAISALLILYSRLFRGNGAGVSVSRHMLYRSFAAVLVGGYLISIGLIGESVKYLGITYGKGVMVFIFFAAGIFTILLLMSAKLRREIKVFVSKNFYVNKHDYRMVWLSFTDRLARCQTMEEVEDSILTSFADIFGLRGAALYLCNKDRGAYTLSAGRFMPEEAGEARFSPGLISYFLQKKRVLNLADGEYAPTVEEASFFSRSGTCLAVPLDAGGELEGVVLLGRQLTAEKLIYEDFDVMKSLAKQSSVALRIFRLSGELSETREVAAVAKMSSFVIHDLKNLASSLSLLVENSRSHISDPAFQEDMITTVQNTLARMLALIRRLKLTREKQELRLERVDLYDLARETVDEISKINRGSTVTCRGGHISAFMDREEIKKVILNLLLNSIESLEGKGAIIVETGENDGYASIVTKDNGCGMTEDFIRNEIFKPFRTTKPKGLGIGLYQCKQIVESHGGKIAVESREGAGSAFTVLLPLGETAGPDSHGAARL